MENKTGKIIAFQTTDLHSTHYDIGYSVYTAKIAGFEIKKIALGTGEYGHIMQDRLFAYDDNGDYLLDFPVVFCAITYAPEIKILQP